MSQVLGRFTRYVRLDSASVLNGPDRPSSPGQARFADSLEAELAAMLGPWTTMRLEDGSLLVRAPAESGSKSSIHAAFLAHIDTYYGLPGAANPRLVECDGHGLDLAPDVSIPSRLLAPFAGKRLVVSDGSGLLGADDKAGVAALMTVLSLIARKRLPHGPIDFWFTTDEEIGRIGVDALPAGVGESWDILWTVDGEGLAELSVGDLAIRRARVVFSGIDAHPCLHGKDLIPAHYAAARFADRLAELPNPMTSEGRAAFYQIASIEGRAERAEVFCRFASFDGADLVSMEEALRKVAESAASAYAAHVAIEVTTGSANFHDAVVSRPELLAPARSALTRAGYEVRDIEIRGGTDGGLLAVSFPGLAAPDLGTGGEKSPFEGRVPRRGRTRGAARHHPGNHRGLRHTVDTGSRGLLNMDTDHERRFHGGADRLRSAERIALMEVSRVVELSCEGLTVKAMLDVGTGTGLFAEAFAALGIAVTGIDVNAELLAAADKLVSAGRFLEAPAESLPFPDRSFDLVFLGLVLHETDDSLAVLKEAYRVTRERVAILEWPYREGPSGPPLEHRLKPETIKGLARNVGFTKIEVINLLHMDFHRLTK